MLLAVLFVMVIASVIVSAVVLTRSELKEIEIVSPPAKTEYIEKQTLDTEGLVVMAHYTRKDIIVTDYTVDKSLLKLGDITVTVSYTDNDITRTATFGISVVARSLSSIEVTKQPDKLTYIEHTYFDPTGIEITAVYDNGERAVVSGFYYDKVGLLQTTDTTVGISYSESGITRTTELNIEVTKREVTKIEVVNPPKNLAYIEGATFDPSGLVIMAYFNNGEQEYVSDWDFDKKGPLQLTDTCVTISYGGYTEEIAISVNKKILRAIMASRLPQKIVYTEGEYFDFLGLEIYASYENAPLELIKGWDYDKKEPLQVTDTNVVVSYSLHNVTKTITIDIFVNEAAIDKGTEQKHLEDILALLPPMEELTEDNLPAIDYVLSVFESTENITQEQKEFKEGLSSKRQEISDNMEPIPEAVFKINYGIADGLLFDDINFGGNPTEYKISDGAVNLEAAYSATAAEQGYEFKGWISSGQAVLKLENITTDTNVYAVFKLTATTDLLFKNYYSGDELLKIENALRTTEYDFEAGGVESVIYSNHGVFPLAFYSEKRIRISSADLSFGKAVTVYVITVEARELHLADGNSVTVGWKFDFTVGSLTEQSEKIPSSGTVFVVPIGATVKMIAMHANIGDILVDGESKGLNLNNNVVQAEFVLSEGEYPVSVTFKTVLKDMTMLLFVGYNQHSIVYPVGWDGIIDETDLNTLSFVYDEASENYLTTYTIDGTVYYYEDLTDYVFGGDTTIWVSRMRNRFSLSVVYSNGIEKIDDLIGKQSLQSALDRYDAEALEILNSIIKESNLYYDAELHNPLTAEILLSSFLREDIKIYSDWEKLSLNPPEQPTFEAVDYSGNSFVNTWTSLFMRGSDIYSSDLALTVDGLYFYTTYVNGNISAKINGVYRIEDSKVVLKTFTSDYEYPLVRVEDLTIDIEFADDGLIRASFIQLSGTNMVQFEHTLTYGNVRPINYTKEEFLGIYQLEEGTIELLANGTATIIYQDSIAHVYYRVNESGKLIVYDNNIIGTGEVECILGE